MITTIHAYPVKELSLAENAEENSVELINRMCQITLEAFWRQKVRGEEDLEKTDSMLEGLVAGWTASSWLKSIRHSLAI